MSLKIIAVVNGKTPDEEYVRIKAEEDINIKGYAVVDRTFNTDGSHSNAFRHIYVFHKFSVKKDDWIRLHTGKGNYHTNTNDDKTIITRQVYWASSDVYGTTTLKIRQVLIKYTLVK
jgi:hypothetical protein